jgi:thiol:disulfide interchange protein
MNLRVACATVLGLFACATAHAADVTDHVEAALIAETTALKAGDADNWIALRLLPDKGWHTYWINPGDSGIPTKITWTLPDGVSAGDIVWPYPERHSLGELTNYGYGGETLHLVPVRVSAKWPAGKMVEMKAEAHWLVCADICIPGTVHLSLSLPVSTDPQPDAGWREAFEHAHAAVPVPRSDWAAHFTVAGSDLSLDVAGSDLDGADAIEMFPVANDLVNHASTQRVVFDSPGHLRLSQHVSNYFVQPPATVDAVFVVKRKSGAHAYRVTATPGPVAVVPQTKASAKATAPATPSEQPAAPPGLALVLLLALAGGLILNLMPCVFPVLSLKALAIMQSRDEGHSHLRHALAYTAGVIASCVIVAGLLIGLRAGGEAIGWGFQLQSPVFVAVLAYLLFALGLSMSGAVQFGASLMGVGESLTRGGGLPASFATGVLAVVVASPCTAPFMGTALGYAMTQPAAVGLLVFAALGLGLALPFLLLGVVPQLARLLPRPGAWMETFRQAMAFPLYLTVAWLLWVLARQTDATGAAAAMVGLVLVAFALWLWNRAGVIALVLRLAALAGALALLASSAFDVRATGGPPAHGEWEPWSTARVAELRAQHRTIFIDFTADWCLTCKLNERAALASDRVHEAIRNQKVALLQGDWTRSDPAITRELEAFGRNGVPLYLVYVDGGEPRVLPQILTADLVVDALAGKP